MRQRRRAATTSTATGLAFDNAQTLRIEPQLRALRVPTLVVWALDDMFFDVKWAHWLARTDSGRKRGW